MPAAGMGSTSCASRHGPLNCENDSICDSQTDWRATWTVRRSPADAAQIVVFASDAVQPTPLIAPDESALRLLIRGVCGWWPECVALGSAARGSRPAWRTH